MTTDPVAARVLTIVSRIAGPERTPQTVDASTPLAEGGFWLDSVELLEVLLTCDETLGPFSPSLGEVDAVLDTLGTLTAAIRARQEMRPA